jgi:hypothetical protein
LSTSYSKIPPTQKSLASHTILVFKDRSNNFKQGVELKAYFNKAKAFFYSSPKLKATFFLVNSVNGAANSEKHGTNFL